MRLCHGTSSRLLDKIMRDGLKPRGSRGGNWSEHPSHPAMVYLTDAFALYFANMAVWREKRNRGKQMFVEVDLGRLDESRLFPDEDLIGQALAHERKWSLQKAQRYALRNLEQWQHCWADAMKHMGTLAHLGPVPPSAITRCAILDVKANPHLEMLMDPTGTSPMIYKCMGEEYRSIQRWVFDGGVLPQVKRFRDCAEAGLEGAAEIAQQWERVSADRTGITVIELAHPGTSVTL